MNIDFDPRNVVLQPTTLCNLDCRYCYLPGRNQNLKMSPIVTRKIADSIREEATATVKVVWHGGEPTSCGLAHFKTLTAPFDDLLKAKVIVHVIQTNATLINEKWCEFFVSDDFRVGISIDGPAWANSSRIDLGGKETHDRILKGVEYLKMAGIDFSAIAVINGESLQKAKELYAFFCELGCSSVGINIEEKEGVNKRDPCDDDAVMKLFWSELFLAWQENPKIEIREFRRILRWMEIVCATKKEPFREDLTFDIFPSVAFNGDVVLLSPEFLGIQSEYYHNFIAGNICKESLSDIIQKGKSMQYVQDFIRGVEQCSATCKYFSYCRGGQASNKFFELGTVDGTETVFCRNIEQRPVDVVLANL